jgi:hypothetical protein
MKSPKDTIIKSPSLLISHDSLSPDAPLRGPKAVWWARSLHPLQSRAAYKNIHNNEVSPSLFYFVGKPKDKFK